MSDSDTPGRISKRRTKGIPPIRFESYFTEMPNSQPQKPVLPQGNTVTPQETRTHQDASSSIATRPSNAQSQSSVQLPAQPPLKSQAQLQSQSLSSRSNEQPQVASEFVSKIAREFDKKMADMRNEFQRQMHAMQELMISNTQQVNNSVLELRNERRLENTNAIPQTPVRNSSVNSERSNTSVEHRQKKIYPLPMFTGKPEEWQSFIESFNSTTSEFNYSNTHNIMRLRDAISGPAKETVEALLSNSANVPAIIETLKETYGRPELIIRSQIEKVRRITPIYEDRLDQLVDFANKVTNMTTFLKNVNGEHHLSNPTLLSEMIGKLPISRQLQWAEKCLSLERPATILEFSDWLNSIRRIANMVSDSLPIMSIQRRTASNVATMNNLPKTNNRKYVHLAVAERKCILCKGECVDLEHCESFKKLSVDMRWQKVKDLKVCFSCMRKGHRSTECFKKKKCSVNGCNRAHNYLLHSTNTNVSTTDTTASSTSVNTNANGDHISCHYNKMIASSDVLFQVVPVKLYGKGTEVTIYAFIDDGSNATIIDSQVAKQLDIVGRKCTLELNWLNRERSSETAEIIELEISSVDENAEKYKMSNVYTSDKLALPRQTFCADEFFDKNADLSKLPLRSYVNVQPKIIISLSHAYLTVPIEVPITGPGPIAVKTRLGWIAYGRINDNANCTHTVCSTYTNDVDRMEEISKLVSSYFMTECFGTKPDVKPIVSKDDARAMAILEKETRKVDGRYEVSLLWKEHCPVLPDSFGLALKRLEGIERKMIRDVNFANEYSKKIEELIEKGYAERINESQAEIRTAKTFYIPHFGVSNPNKNSIRIVFDAAAEINNVSLNKMLLTGPDINQHLIAVLFKFRQAPVAVTGDIQEMFLQIAVRKEDCDSQRFLWRKGKPENPLETYVMKRLIFGATCSPTVAQYIKNYNAKKFENVYPRAVQGICERHYVDDYADCFQTEDEAVKVINEVINIHKAAGFNLRHINSNSEKVRNKFSSHNEQSVQIEKESERILGMHWLTKSDSFVFKIKWSHIPKKILEFTRKPTKRELLKIHMSIFDPYGFLVNFMITAKVIMQAVWKSGIQWDDEISDELYKYWKFWMKELPKVQQFEIPRLYAPMFQTASIELHVFTDASEQAMAVVAYWRVVEAGQVTVAFVSAKSRCAPIRHCSIPKMELQAATMGVRLMRAIIDNHDVNVCRCVFWTDSYTVLRWIRSDHRKYKQYVVNRVAEILEGSTAEQWRWCPGAYNTADDGTRAKYANLYENEGRWKYGPEFLMKDEAYWPQEVFGPHIQDKSNDEMRSKFVFVAAQWVSYIAPNINRFSSYSRYKRATAWILRYVANLKKRIKGVETVKGPLTADEEHAAQIYLCRNVQMQSYPDELQSLKNDKIISQCSELKMLNPVIGEDGLIRCNGRLERAECLPVSARKPIILPNKHALTRLIVQFYHNKFQHINSATTVGEIRQTFWIPSLRRLINTVQSNCMVCKIRRAKPIQPQMSALPVDRVQPYVRPFSYTGVDLFGPFYVTIRRAREKRWVCLFTCLTVRAVHLEVAMDLSTDAFILCLRNFMNRRGVPLQIRSDNGTNFVGVFNELKGTMGFLDHDDMTARLAPLGIKWIYNTPANPAQGGVWERLVQSIKKVLYNMLKEEAPKLDTFNSLLIEAECIVNARPLTHLPVTPSEPEPLTPNHFLLSSTNSTQTPAAAEPRLNCLRKQWRVLMNLKNSFWQRWIREYLPELTRRTKWCLPAKELQKGSLVLICDPDAPRSQWKRGRVAKLYPGKDGIVRSAEVNTSTGALKRPISKLAVLDVEVSVDE